MKTAANQTTNLPGLELIRALREGRKDLVTKIAWSPDGNLLAVPTQSGLIELWNPTDGSHVDIKAHAGTWTTTVAWSPDSCYIAAGSGDGRTRVWHVSDGRRQPGRAGSILAVKGNLVSWSPDGKFLAVGLVKGPCSVWDTQTWVEHSSVSVQLASLAFSHPSRLALASRDGKIVVIAVEKSAPIRVFAQPGVRTVAWSPDGTLLAGGSSHGTICLFDVETKIAELQGHTRQIRSLSFSCDGAVLASKSDDGTVRLWDTCSYASLAVIDEKSLDPRIAGYSNKKPSGLAFHPSTAVLATLDKADRQVRLWKLDIPLLTHGTRVEESIRYTTAKIVLVGNSGVGKTGLGWRLAHGSFKEHPSTHGQQFWVVESMKGVRPDRTECEAVLWDLAGQPDYRLTHALFLDKVDLALVLFDPGNHSDPLAGVEYWLKALEHEGTSACRKILVAARADRASPSLTRSDLDSFCRRHEIQGGFIATSARSGEGIEELLACMRREVAWDEMAATVTTATFKRVREFVLSLKESGTQEILLDPSILESKLRSIDPEWRFSAGEMMTAVQHLANHGYVKVLKESSGRESILMSPEVLSNLASSFVLEARRSPAGLGALEESRVLRGEYDFPEVSQLREKDREILLDATVALFLEHNVCFRERLGSGTFLIFPSLINQKKPTSEQAGMIEDVSYTVSGHVENVYAALVVLLGYSNTFTRTNQWQNQAEYEMNPGEICGFKQITERDGEIDLIHYYGPQAGPHVRSLFQGLFESFLLARDVTVTKYPPVSCPDCGYRPERVEIIKRVKQQKSFLFCGECGEKITLPPAVVEKPSVRGRAETLAQDQQAANQRTEFETALTQLKGLIRNRDPQRTPPTCFVSYAWGDDRHERWVVRFARDLQNADIHVLLDRKDNAKIGSSIATFVNEIEQVDFVVVVGTQEYLSKYKNLDPARGTFVSAEMDIINQRLTGPKAFKDSVLPVILAGDKFSSLPPLLRGRVYARFEQEESYFPSLFDILLALYGFASEEQAIYELRQLVAGDEG